MPKILCPIVSTAVCFGPRTVADYRSAIVELCLRRKERPSAFSLAAGGISLTHEGKIGDIGRPLAEQISPANVASRQARPIWLGNRTSALLE